VLASGLRTSRALDTLNLDANPLGPEGGACMLQALANRHARVISMQDCNFSPMAVGGEGAAAGQFFDVHRPNHRYRLNLESAADYAVASTLVRRRQFDETGADSWRYSTLDGKVLFERYA
jgi:hypothetical protein